MRNSFPAIGGELSIPFARIHPGADALLPGAVCASLCMLAQLRFRCDGFAALFALIPVGLIACEEFAEPSQNYCVRFSCGLHRLTARCRASEGLVALGVVGAGLSG